MNNVLKNVLFIFLLLYSLRALQEIRVQWDRLEQEQARLMEERNAYAQQRAPSELWL